MHLVISETQSVFIKGRQSLGGMLIANEIVDEAKRAKKRGSCSGLTLRKLMTR